MFEPPEARIRVQPNGPYVVTGEVPMARRAIEKSEHGEPLGWRTTSSLGSKRTVALCRCGGSSNKPFCDGTHSRNGFDGTESAATDTYDDRATVYEGAGVVVRDDRGLCQHAGFCGNRLSNVWDMVRQAGREDSDVQAQMTAMIELCPSGALSYRLAPESADVEPELPKEIVITDDGPYFVTGGIPVDRADGLVLESRNRMTLCRCGASANKPLCDGSHQNAGFRDS